ncbi:MAG: NAD(P)-binding domain-containing protein, partial [Bosea sp. (in: a-proteobacteria)]|nr:NAD(P)-binding domain-containing protein [Bosea sp. (in: a-proteobacteria)]
MPDSDSSPAPIAFIGLGQMGLPMVRRLIAAGFTVRGADPAEAPRQALVEAGGLAFADASQA